MTPSIQPKPLRKNARNASIVVVVEKDGITSPAAYYATVAEALAHVVSAREGSIISRGGSQSKLLAFWSAWGDCLRFGFGADQLFRSQYRNAYCWAQFNESPL